MFVERSWRFSHSLQYSQSLITAASGGRSGNCSAPGRLKESYSYNPCSPILTHGAVVSHESRVSLLVGEVGGEEDAEGVSRGGDELQSWHRLRVRLLPATEQRQHLPLCLHLQTQQNTPDTGCLFFIMKKQLKSQVSRSVIPHQSYSLNPRSMIHPAEDFHLHLQIIFLVKQVFSPIFPLNIFLFAVKLWTRHPSTSFNIFPYCSTSCFTAYLRSELYSRVI